MTTSSPLRLWLCTRCAETPGTPDLNTCLLIRRDTPGDGWRAVNSAHLEPETLIDIACQLAELAAGLITEAHEAAAELRRSS